MGPTSRESRSSLSGEAPLWLSTYLKHQVTIIVSLKLILNL
jgi:hypothetical protein